MPKHILYVEGNPDGTVGGSFFSLLYLLKNLDTSRFVATAVFSKENPLTDAFRAAGATVIIRPLARPFRRRGAIPVPLTRMANTLLGYVWEPLRLVLFLRRQKIDLVHLNNSIERNHPWMIASIIAGIPRITHERGMNRRLSPLAGRLVRRLDAVICISGAVRGNLERLGLADCRLKTIWNGLDASEMRPRLERSAVLAEFGLSPSTELVGMVGNIRGWKGQAVVVDAMAELHKARPNLVCLLIGDHTDKDLAYKTQIEHSIASQGLQRHVIITGYRSNVADYVAALDVLIHASVLPEPFGRVLLEGMALRKPLVASRDGAVPEIVEDGVTGLLFESGNAADLAAKLSWLLDSPSQLRAMGEAGFARLQEKFGIHENARQTMAIYEDILK